MDVKSCNICSGERFKDFNGRKQVMCMKCESLERHRLVKWTLEQLGYLNAPGGENHNLRILHLAPEVCTHSYIAGHFGAAYYCSDYSPNLFPHAQCLKLSLPEGFAIFPDNYFNLILHNHVLEHIPGDLRDHLAEFSRLLEPGGNMIFTIPAIKTNAPTLQGGEHLSSDAERKKIHGQWDHYKSFGYDFYEYFCGLPGKLITMQIPQETRQRLNAPVDTVYVWQQDAQEVKEISFPSEFEICSIICSSGLFDADYYLSHNKDVAVYGIDPLLHYVRYGENEMRNPSSYFDLQLEKMKYKHKNNILYQSIINNKQLKG